MNKAQTAFITTTWVLLILSAMFFLVPNPYPSAEGAAWTCLGVGLASHFALLVAIIYDRAPVAVTPPDAA